jgi:hypothetical protein
MPAPAPFAINDGAATPVSHTFTPIGKDKAGILWYEQTTPVPASPIAAKRIGYRQYRGDPMSKVANGSGKVVYTLHVPTPETLSTNDSGLIPPATLAYKQIARLEFDLPERGSKQERKDTRILIQNLLGLTSFVGAAIDDLQPTYGG